MDHDARPNTAELLALLPPLPDVKRPFLRLDNLAKNLDEGDVEVYKEMISGRFLDYLLSELLSNLPDIAQSLESLGPAGLTLQARPSNTINALTVPTRDGVVIIYNLGFYSMLHSVATAVALVTTRQSDGVVEYVSNLVDWATSRAKEPRITLLELDDDQSSLAANIAGQGQRFAMCHELGHVITFDRDEEPSRPAIIEGVAVSALRDTWDKEYAADRDGLDMFLRVLESRSRSASAALIGAELFLNTAGMLQESSVDEGQAHPPPDERLFRVRNQFLEVFGDRAVDLAQPAITVQHILEALRYQVTLEVQRRRAETTAQLIEAFDSYAARGPNITPDEKRAAAFHVSRFLLASPGATLDFLHEKLFAPRGSDEPDGGSPARILALNAALHFEKPLQAAIEVPRLRFS